MARASNVCAPSSSRPLLTGLRRVVGRTAEEEQEDGVCQEGLGLWLLLVEEGLVGVGGGIGGA